MIIELFQTLLIGESSHSPTELQQLASTTTDVFFFLIVFMFLLSVFFRAKQQHSDFTDYAPTLLSSLGILGTFAGIIIGLVAFNPSAIDKSITDLLAGLQTGFFTSIFGIFLSITYKIIENLLPKPAKTKDEMIELVSEKALLTQQIELLTTISASMDNRDDQEISKQLQEQIKILSAINTVLSDSQSIQEKSASQLEKVEAGQVQTHTLLSQVEKAITQEGSEISNHLDQLKQSNHEQNQQQLTRLDEINSILTTSQTVQEKAISQLEKVEAGQVQAHNQLLQIEKAISQEGSEISNNLDQIKQDNHEQNQQQLTQLSEINSVLTTSQTVQEKAVSQLEKVETGQVQAHTQLLQIEKAISQEGSEISNRLDQLKQSNHEQSQQQLTQLGEINSVLTTSQAVQEKAVSQLEKVEAGQAQAHTLLSQVEKAISQEGSEISNRLDQLKQSNHEQNQQHLTQLSEINTVLTTSQAVQEKAVSQLERVETAQVQAHNQLSQIEKAIIQEGSEISNRLDQLKQSNDEQNQQQLTKLDEINSVLTTSQAVQEKAVSQLEKIETAQINAVNELTEVNQTLTQSEHTQQQVITHFDHLRERQQAFEQRLWQHFAEFSEMLSKSATEQVITALKQVITDFNQNLTEQFGENFKQLNSAVDGLLKWQDNYRQQLEQMIDQYAQGVQAITQTEASVTNISQESAKIPVVMNDLKSVLEVNQHQITGLNDHLQTFATMRDKAIDAVPQLTKLMDETMTEMSHASNQLTTAIVKGAEAFDEHTTRTNSALQTSSEQITTHSETIKTALHTTATQLQEAFNKLLTELQTQQDSLMNYHKDATQSFLDHYQSTQNQLKDFAENTIGVTENAVKLQVQQIDKALQDEINQTMEQMGQALVSITKRFTDDYKTLVDEMTKVVQTRNSI